MAQPHRMLRQICVSHGSGERSLESKVQLRLLFRRRCNNETLSQFERAVYSRQRLHESHRCIRGPITGEHIQRDRNGSQHKDATFQKDVAGNEAVVVGTCNSGHDISQNYYEKGADVTTL